MPEEVGNAVGKPLRLASLMRTPLAFAMVWLAASNMLQAHAGTSCTADRAHLVTIGAQTFDIVLAANLKQRERGLSGRETLEADSGMWFVFPAAGKHGFWMKDMTFPIDLIWVGPDRKVLGSTTLLPCAAMPCPIHLPPAPVAYVLEINAGTFSGGAGDRVSWSCTAPKRKGSGIDAKSD